MLFTDHAVRGYNSVAEHSTADREVPGSTPGAPTDHAVRGYSSVAEHSTADREVPGSTPGAPCFTPLT